MAIFHIISQGDRQITGKTENKGKLEVTQSEAVEVKLASDIRALIDEGKRRVSAKVNSELTLLYWNIGRRLLGETLEGERAQYGKKVIANVSRQLTASYGRGWSEKQLHHCIRLAESFPEKEIVSALRRQLSWTHLKILMYVTDPLKRNFYIELCRVEGWSSRQLRERMGTLLFERTAISKKPEDTIAHELVKMREAGIPSPQLLLKDPYLLDFLGLNDRYLERDLEDAILRELEQFLLEMGAGFTFVARQKRLQIDNEDFYLDLLLYNRKLKRLVVVELKVGSFRAEYKGQMELYLRWLAKFEQEPGEESPLGLILCTGKSPEQIELLELDLSGIHVAEYLTVLPDKKLLEAKLKDSIQRARERLQLIDDD